jgi:ABC-type dipeptide/oligopeptide/nickel transport system permease component
VSEHLAPAITTPDDFQAQLLARIQRVEASSGQAARTVEDERNRQQTLDRSWIAKMIIYVFVGAVGAVLLLLFVQAAMTKDWSSVSGTATDLVKSTILPIVTLVLGYYFGQSDRK